MKIISPKNEPTDQEAHNITTANCDERMVYMLEEKDIYAEYSDRQNL